VEVLTRCPLEAIDSQAWEVIAAADLAKHGCWPVAGGWLDQVHGLREAVRFVWSEQSRLKARTLEDACA
jgi:ADP-ribose pyrophosphatase YjhB (NUDIX family)